MNDTVKLWIQIFFVVFFLALIPVSFVTGIIKSVSFVSLLSLWALVAAHGAWAESAAVKRTQDDEKLAKKVVKEVVDKTEVSPE